MYLVLAPHNTYKAYMIDELRRAAHSSEIFSRLRWCISQELFPANIHVHKAPGDDSRFVVRRQHLSQRASTYT